jgi:carbon monoxide dehydrogenase subunit G
LTWGLLGLALAAEPGWEVLQHEQVSVACTGLDGSSFRCEATAELPVGPQQVWALLRDPEHFPEVFPSVRSASQRDDGRYDVALDLPWPLPAWPLVVEAEVYDGSRQLVLRDVGGGRGVWSEAEVRVQPVPQGSRLIWGWTGRPLVGWLHRRIQRTYGHNTVWAVAMALDVTPTAVSSAVTR